MKNLTTHVMNSTETSAGGYEGSEMYTYIHNTILPNLKKSGLNITACDLVSRSVFNDICSKTGNGDNHYVITGGEEFWSKDSSETSGYFYYVSYDGGFKHYRANTSRGVRPLITVVK